MTQQMYKLSVSSTTKFNRNTILAEQPSNVRQATAKGFCNVYLHKTRSAFVLLNEIYNVTLSEARRLVEMKYQRLVYSNLTV